MSSKRYQKQARFFQALAHPVRLQILALLSQGPVCVCDLMPHTGQRQAYISQQLAILGKERLVHGRRKGKRIQYELVESVIQQALYTAFKEFLDFELSTGLAGVDLNGSQNRSGFQQKER